MTWREHVRLVPEDQREAEAITILRRLVWCDLQGSATDLAAVIRDAKAYVARQKVTP